jgi:rare lipoprotein A (peptidoglycan hydrolase)
MLAAMALLAVAISLAVTERHQARVRAALLPPSQGSYTALVGSSGAREVGRTTACGVVVGSRTMGIASPVLPCGVRLYLTFRGRHVLAPVIGRGPSGPGREFDLTQALAQQLGIAGVRRVRWSYAGAE